VPQKFPEKLCHTPGGDSAPNFIQRHRQSEAAIKRRGLSTKHRQQHILVTFGTIWNRLAPIGTG
jgi:hypothetical protein